MTPVTPQHFVVIAALLFCVGALGALIRRNALVLLLGIELMLNASNLVLLAYARQYGDTGGHVLAMLVLAVIVAETVVGLSIVQGVFRLRHTIDVDGLDALRDDA